MGIDAVELVIEVEDHFGIAITDAEAAEVRTVGDLVALIHSRIEAGRRHRCATLTSFLHVRRAVRKTTGDPTLRVRTDTRLSELLTPSQRKRLWKALRTSSGVILPPLCRPEMLHYTLVSLSMMLFLAAFVVAVAIDVVMLPLTLALAAVAAIVLNLATKRFRTVPPDDLATCGALAKRLVGLTVATKQLTLETTDAILHELQPIIAEQLGVDRAKVTLSASFANDLGMG